MNVTMIDKMRCVFQKRTLEFLFPYVIVISFAFLFLALLWSNPGYFNHDELQKLDHVQTHGLKHYFQQYVKLAAGSHFGVPVRPFSFAVQGLLALFIEDYPIVVHGFGVLSHGLVACVVFQIVKNFGGSQRTAYIAAFIFLLNPMTILATGWSAALMDRFYVLFGLLAFIGAHQYTLGKHKHLCIGLIFVSSSLAILSKETALMLPALMLVLLVQNWKVIWERRFWIAGLVWVAPILIFLIIRLPAIMASFSGQSGSSSYSMSFGNVFESLYIYLSYPFLTELTSAVNWVFIKPIKMQLASIMQLVLGVMLWRKYNVKITLLYFALYIGVLLPVLPIASKGAHYLYGSAAIMSVALSFIITHRSNKLSLRETYLMQVISIVMICVMLSHTINLQKTVYDTGRCMSKIISSTEGAFIAAGKPKNVSFTSEVGAASYMLSRTYFGRSTIGNTRDVKFQFNPIEGEKWADSHEFKLSKECVVSYIDAS